MCSGCTVPPDNKETEHAKGGGGGFSLWEASEDYFEVCFVGLMVRGNYVGCLAMFVIFMGFGGAEVGDALKSSFRGGNASHKKGEAILMGKEGWGSHFVTLLY